MEKLDLYTKDGTLTGKVINRGEKPQNGEYIKLCVVYLKCQNKFLMQKCSVQKGGEYAITGGHVSSGNTSISQAVIEVKEELGFDIDISKLQFLGNIYRPTAIFDVFLYEDSNLQNLEITLQEEEVESVSWLTKSEIDNLISLGLVRPSSCEHYTKFIK